MNTNSILITWNPKIDQTIGEVKAIHFLLTDEGEVESILDIRTDTKDDNNLFRLAHIAISNSYCVPNKSLTYQVIYYYKKYFCIWLLYDVS